MAVVLIAGAVLLLGSNEPSPGDWSPYPGAPQGLTRYTVESFRSISFASLDAGEYP